MERSNASPLVIFNARVYWLFCENSNPVISDRFLGLIKQRTAELIEKNSLVRDAIIRDSH